MRGYSPGYYSPPQRGYGGRGRSPPRRGYSPPRRGYSPPRRGYSPPRRGYGGSGGGYGRRKEANHGSLLVRNIPLDCRPEDLRIPFEDFGLVRDVYIPKDYYTGEPRGFAFVQFVDSHDALEAQCHMNGKIFLGREITVVLAAESRKRPEEMRRKTRQRSGGPRYGGGRRSPYRRSRSRSVSRSRSPHYRSGSRAVRRSRSYSGSPRRRDDYSASPSRRPAGRSRSPPRDSSPRGDQGRRSYSPPANGYDKQPKYEAEDAGGSPRRLSRSPSGSRSRSASPGRSR